MFWVWLALAASSLLDLIAGMVLLLWRRGSVHTRTGGDTPGWRGRSIGAEATAEVSYADLKAMVRAGQWGPVLPSLLVIGGMLGLFLFGGLAFWSRTENALLGNIVLGICLYAVVRTLYSILRA
jgi:hypothetical protein